MLLEEPKNLGGRPRKPVDLAEIQRLAAIGCTQIEIADNLDLSVDTLRRDPGFASAYRKGQAFGKKSLRRRQFEVAADGNAQMLIWLGKNFLGQKETLVTQHEGEITINVAAKERLISKLALNAPAEPTEEGDSVVN